MMNYFKFFIIIIYLFARQSCIWCLRIVTNDVLGIVHVIFKSVKSACQEMIFLQF